VRTWWLLGGGLALAVVEALLRRDPGLRLGNSPRVWALRAMAWVAGRSELLARIDGGQEAAR
jgi:hypothetical protein